MSSALRSEATIREYLLGRVSDEETLAGLEELLFTDEEFCTAVALAEDSLINEYALEQLDATDAKSFRATLATNPDRSFQVELTRRLRVKALAACKRRVERPSFLAAVVAFFQQPKYVGAFAVLLVTAIGLVVYFSNRGNPDELAELRSLYRQARPTEVRLAQFSYAPWQQLRGAPEPAEQQRLRKIEIKLIEATEKNPDAETHHALGVFNLTQQKYSEAIRELTQASQLAPQNAQLHNDLGAAHFESAKSGPKENRLASLAQSLDEFTKATELDPDSLEALFNKSLALQELDLPREAKESWTLYLQKDSTSPWAGEARRHLARSESEQSLFKSDEQVLADFLLAYRNHDEPRMHVIHNETKGLLKGVTVPLQLSRRYLWARQRGDQPEASENLAALTYLGKLEQNATGDSFFFELANFYEQAGREKFAPLLEAQELFARAQQLIVANDPENAIRAFEKSRDLFTQLGNSCEAAIAEIWAVQLLRDVARLAESRLRLNAFLAHAESRGFIVLLPPAYYSLGIVDYRQNRLSESARNLKTALQLAETGENAFEIQHAEDALRFNYAKLGELEPSLFFASRMLSDKLRYYQSYNQYLRDKGTLCDLALRLNFSATAFSLAKEALSVVQEHSLDDVRLNNSLRHLVQAACAKSDFPNALRYANESLEVALKRDDGAENLRTKAESYRWLADVKRATNAYRDALADYDQALTLYQRLPEVTVGLYQIHKGKLFCFQQLHEQENFAAELQTVLALSEEYRTTIREDSSRQAFFASEQDVFDAATANALVQRNSERAFAFVEAAKARSLLEFVESGESIAAVEKNLAAVVQPLTLPQIQARLPQPVQLVQYAVLPDKLAIWIVSQSRFELFEKQISAAELERKIVAYQALLVGKGPPAELRQSGRELYELLVPPNLAPGKQLCLVPDKFLHQLSFASLVSPNDKYLLEAHALYYAPSASVSVLAGENARRRERAGAERLLAIGNPDFDRQEHPNLPDLRDAATEARAIASEYQESIALFAAQATKEKFLEEFANVEVIHFAGHFLTNPQSPGNSKLLFAGGELRSAELAAYKLNHAKLVVLSACETGFEQYNKSEGAIGVARTLLALGAPLVVASKWKVDSAPTKDLLIAFHRKRKHEGLSSTESLRQAQLDLLAHEETAAPFYWAAFSLFGGYARY
jgi:CHAT domain-containing protein